MVFTIVSNTVRLYAIRGGIGAFASSFLNPGEAYRQTQLLAEMYRNGEAMPMADFAWVFRINTLLAVFNGLYFPLALICWRQMRISYRVIFFVALLSSIVFTTGVGYQSGIGFLFFGLLPVVLYKLYVVPRRTKIGATRVAAGRSGLNRVFAMALAGLAICALVATVAWFQLDRAENRGRSLDAARELGAGFSSPSAHGLVPITGGRLNFGLVMACMYFSHGYEGLALAMELPFEPTYGLGWSGALQSIYRDYLGGPDLSQRSYMERSSQRYGWPRQWWSTIFTWIASDTTYYGTVLFMVLVGFVIGRCWVGVVITGNPIGFAVLAQMFTLVFMFPANNALAQTLDGLFSLIGVLIIYAASWQYFVPSRTGITIKTLPDRKRISASFKVRNANMSSNASRLKSSTTS